MFERLSRALFGKRSPRHRDRPPVAAEVLEQRVLLAGNTLWTDGAAGDHDFKTPGNWTNGVPWPANPMGAPDTGVFNGGWLVDVTDQHDVYSLNFEGTTDVTMDFFDGSECTWRS